MKNPRKISPSLLIAGSFRFEAIGLPKLVGAVLAVLGVLLRLALLWHHAA